jgi:hypothetical protein
MWQAIGGLASSILGGAIVAIVSYAVGRKKIRAEIRKLEAEAKRIDAEAEKILKEAGTGGRVGRGAALTLGWDVTGARPHDYEIVIDQELSHGGSSCAKIKARPAARGFAAIKQECNAYKYLGKRLRLSAYIKTDNARHAALWFRVDGPNNEALAFDNMGGRPVSGTTDWRRYEIVLEVPKAPEVAKAIVFGALLVEQGTMWVDDFCLEEVRDAVSVTDTLQGTPLLTEPTNLDFEY